MEDPSVPPDGASGLGRWVLDAGCWRLVVGCWVLVVGCWVLDVEPLPFLRYFPRNLPSLDGWI
ncbi:MAG: hypothetical protein FJ221_17955 [Lentisphaerae bacterium]|nr:hypothetical protein [Lentisphaerota bacterium]